MSTVKYFNKKANRFLVYEYTAHTDPITNRSKPIRKYLGYEDPVTHIFTPSSAKRGRPKKESTSKRTSQRDQEQDSYAALYAELQETKAALNSERARSEILLQRIHDLEKKVLVYQQIADMIRRALEKESSLK